MGERYNGWRNVETWAVALHVMNDEGLYRQSLEAISDASDRPTALKDTLEDIVFALIANIPGRAFIADLLQSALDRVDWTEIVEALKPYLE